MEVDLPSICPCQFEWVERVHIKSSPVARGAQTARMLALLLCRNRYCPCDCFGEAQVDLRLDMSANGTQALGLHLGQLMANSADLSRRSPVEEAQTYMGHYRPSCREEGTFNPDARRSAVRRINPL